MCEKLVQTSKKHKNIKKKEIILKQIPMEFFHKSGYDHVFIRMFAGMYTFVKKKKITSLTTTKMIIVPSGVRALP